MYNCFRYDQALYNIGCLIADQNRPQYPYLEQVLPKDVDIFAYGCANFKNDKNIRIKDITNEENIPKLSINKYDTPRYHGGGLLGYYFREKVITIELIIIGCEDDCSMHKKLDCIKRCVSKPNQRMIRNYCGDKRCTVGYLSNRDFKQDRGCVSIGNLTMEFTTLDPFWYDCEQTEINQFDMSSINYPGGIVNFMLENKGSAPTFLRTIIVFATASGVNQIKISVNGAEMTINQNISTGDFIEINGDQRDVYYNSINGIDYLGNIDYLQPGLNPVIVTINGTRTGEIKNLYHNARL